jgi:hypothetical protein
MKSKQYLNTSDEQRVETTVSEQAPPAVRALTHAAAELAREHTDLSVDIAAGAIALRDDASLMWAVPDLEAALAALVPGARLLWNDSIYTVEAFGPEVSDAGGDRRHVRCQEEDSPAPIHERLLRTWFASPIPFVVVSVPENADVPAGVRSRGVRPVTECKTGLTVSPDDRPAFALPGVATQTATSEVSVAAERASEDNDEPVVRELPTPTAGGEGA